MQFGRSMIADDVAYDVVAAVGGVDAGGGDCGAAGGLLLTFVCCSS